ncbi:MAG TPA: ABC transporter substrate-binding protein [Rhodopila sp.]|nr:ABC transporter substrate-binding protein [Rhodopila sp.]
MRLEYLTDVWSAANRFASRVRRAFADAVRHRNGAGSQPRKSGGRRAFLVGVACLGLCAAGSVWAAGTADIDQPLRRLYAALDDVMKSGRQTPFPRRFDMLAPVVDQVFDLETVLKMSVGARWDSINPDTRAHLLQVYRRFTVATYVANFDRYEGERFRILPGSRDAGQDRIVGTEIISGSGDRQRLDYLMRDENGTWRVIDILLDGSISRVAVQRSDFRKILASGDADTLIDNLRRKISDLSDGTLSS